MKHVWEEWQLLMEVTAHLEGWPCRNIPLSCFTEHSWLYATQTTPTRSIIGQKYWVQAESIILSTNITALAMILSRHRLYFVFTVYAYTTPPSQFTITHLSYQHHSSLISGTSYSLISLKNPNFCQVWLETSNRSLVFCWLESRGPRYARLWSVCKHNSRDLFQTLHCLVIRTNRTIRRNIQPGGFRTTWQHYWILLEYRKQ